MNIRLRHGLPFVSAGCVFATEQLLAIGLQYQAEDVLHRIRGIGGSEFVFTKQIDRLALGELYTNDFVIEVGGMDYGFDIEGIVGMDFLSQIGAVVDLARLEVHGTPSAVDKET